MASKATRYPAEFREEAIRLYRTSGRSITKLSEDLGVSDPTLRGWVKQAEIEAGDRSGLTNEEKEELRKLRRENRTLKEEREILKKAAAFFAKEENRRP